MEKLNLAYLIGIVEAMLDNELPQKKVSQYIKELFPLIGVSDYVEFTTKAAEVRRKIFGV